MALRWPQDGSRWPQNVWINAWVAHTVWCISTCMLTDTVAVRRGSALRYMYIYTIYRNIYKCMYIHICTCIDLRCLHVWLCVFVRVCVCLHVCVCVGTCPCVCEHMCMYIYIYIHACMLASMHACMHPCMQSGEGLVTQTTQTNSFVNDCVCIHGCMLARMHLSICVCMHAWMHACMHGCMHACMYVWKQYKVL